jgi:hypothetical protein
MQKIRIIGFFFDNRLHWQFKVGKKFYKRLLLGYMFIYVQIIHLEFGNSLSNLGTQSTVTIHRRYLRLNLSTTPDLKF